MAEYHEYKESGFFNGLILGLAIGAGLMFLLGTKRGKILWDTLKESGYSVLNDVEDLFEELEGDIDVMKEEKERVPEVGEFGIPLASLSEHIAEPPLVKPIEIEETKAAPSRRFFHGIPKRK